MVQGQTDMRPFANDLTANTHSEVCLSACSCKGWNDLTILCGFCITSCRLGTLQQQGLTVRFRSDC
jgi:hypothetical protein